MATLTQAEIAQAHAIQELALDRASALRSLIEIRDLLGTALDAVHGGSKAVTEEYLDRALVEAADAVDKLKGN